MGSEPLILLYTHSLVWLDQATGALGSTARATADRALRAGKLATSVMAFWEVAMLLAKGGWTSARRPRRGVATF
jgi:PIN domain nuclease of toxin-antitoxin system